MPNMNDQHINWLENQLERFVEGAFASLFGRKFRTQDVALQLARAMQDNLRLVDNDPRPLAPDQYNIYLNPDIHAQLMENQPALAQKFSTHVVDLVSHVGYRLTNAPLVKFIADKSLDSGALIVRAQHTNRPENSTAAMERVEIPKAQASNGQTQLLINGERAVALTKNVINIGRGLDNDIILEDQYVSRHHVQLRLRFGAYTLFDVHSQSGTQVNNIAVKEHRLQSGDVIQIGSTQLIFVEDSPEPPPTGSTEAIEPLI